MGKSETQRVNLLPLCPIGKCNVGGEPSGAVALSQARKDQPRELHSAQLPNCPTTTRNAPHIASSDRKMAWLRLHTMDESSSTTAPLHHCNRRCCYHIAQSGNVGGHSATALPTLPLCHRHIQKWPPLPCRSAVKHRTTQWARTGARPPATKHEAAPPAFPIGNGHPAVSGINVRH